MANRSDYTVELSAPQIVSSDNASKSPLDAPSPLKPHASRFDTLYHVVTQDEADSSPYWLREEWTLGMYAVADQRQRGRAEGADYLEVVTRLKVAGADLSLERPVRYHYTDPVDGEQFQPFELLPPVFVQAAESSYLFTDDSPKSVVVKVTAARDELTGQLSLEAPAGWSVTPATQQVDLPKKGQELFYTFDLTPTGAQGQGKIVPTLRLAGDTTAYRRRLVVIDHAHIPTQLAALPGGASVARVELKTAGRTVGYLPGAGDAIPEALSSIGLRVSVLDDTEASIGDLSKYDAVVVGVRAYNTLDRMPVYQPRLLDYVKRGGTLIVQYNTNRRLKVDESELGPYPLHLSRDRVTVEDAPVEILAPDHPALNYPNKITKADFTGWVQERGLYFPDEWSDEYTALLGSHDPGEDSHDGGLLVANYGDGHFVYTGYSFFRELPAGVPGAYRLFANLIALGQEASE